MRDSEHIATGLLTATEELRQLILDNPGLPLLVFAGEDSNNGEYGYMACSSVRASLGEFLDCQQEVDDTYCFTDKDDFSERLEDQLYDSFKGSEEEFKALLQEKLVEYNSYWKPCIILYVDN